MPAVVPDQPLRDLAAMAARFGLADRRTRGQRARPPARVRLAQRLASGLTPRQAALAGGTDDEAVVERLLAEDDFQALVAAYRELAEAPEAVQTARLVRLAWLAIENALLCGDMAAGFFVLRETSFGRDPAVTVAGGVIAAARRRPRATAAPLPPLAPPPPVAPLREPPGDPGLRLIARGAANLRRALAEEHAAQAVAAAAAPAARTAAEASRRALALRPAATPRPAATGLAPSAPGAAPPRPTEPAPVPAASALPRRPQAP